MKSPQLVDTAHERFAGSRTGGFTYRRDTYEASSIYSARPHESGGREIQQSSYRRRTVSAAATSAPPSTGSGTMPGEFGSSSDRSHSPPPSHKRDRDSS